MKVDSDNLAAYVSDFLKGIEKGLGEDYYIKGSVSFDLAVVNKKDKGGGIKIHIVDLGGKYKTSEVSRVKFEVSKKLTAKDIHDFPKEDKKDWRFRR